MLQTSSVPRCLDKKLVLFGYEFFDLILIFFLLSVLKLIFANSNLIWIPVIALALTLKFGKKSKPENYLLHLVRFYCTPGHYSAFKEEPLEHYITRKASNLELHE